MLEQGLQPGPAVPSCSDTGKAALHRVCLPDAGQEAAAEQRHSLVLISSRCFVAETGSSVLGAGFMWHGGRSARAPSPLISWQKSSARFPCCWSWLQSLQRAPKAEELCFVQDFETLIKIKRAVKFQIEEFNHLVTIRTSFFGVSYSKYSKYSVQTLTVRATPDISEVLLAQIQRIPHKATEFFSVTLGGSCVLLSIFLKDRWEVKGWEVCTAL